MPYFRTLLAAVGLSLALGSSAANTGLSDHAILSCNASTLQLISLATSYQSFAKGNCAEILKGLSNEGLTLISSQLSGNNVVYTLGYPGFLESH